MISNNPIVPAKHQGANFTGPYSISSWTEKTSAAVGTLWNISNVPSSVTLNTYPMWQTSADWMTITAAASGLVTFSWSCSTADGNNYPVYLINDAAGPKTQLNAPVHGICPSSGNSSFYVNEGDTFGFQIIAYTSAQASLTISNLTAPVHNQSVNFTGPYVAGSWTEHTSAPVSTLWNITNAPASITLKNCTAWQTSADWMTINAATTGMVTFNWSCSAQDGNVCPVYFIDSSNGPKVHLNAALPDGSCPTSGTGAYRVNKGDQFGFQIIANTSAAESFTISNFSAPINDQCVNFTEAYVINNWTEKTSAPVSTLWNISNVPASVTLNNDPAWATSADWMTITATATGVVSFDWTCSSADGNADPVYYLGGNPKVQLNAANPGGGFPTSGSCTYVVQEGDTIGFQIIANTSAQTSFTISNFSAPIQ